MGTSWKIKFTAETEEGTRDPDTREKEDCHSRKPGQINHFVLLLKSGSSG